MLALGAIALRQRAQLARNRLAPTLSLVSPGLIRTIVHRATVSELRDRLAAEGIDAGPMPARWPW